MAGFNKKWQSIPIPDILKFFLCSDKIGLSSQEVVLRIHKLGDNTIPYFPAPIWNILTTTVIREGRKTKVSNSTLALGDIVILEKNKLVPADIRLIEVDNLSVNQASLTGSEAIVYKNANSYYIDASSNFNIKNMAYAGSLVAHGRAIGIVVATNKDTQIAKTKIQPKIKSRKLKKLHKLLNEHEIIMNDLSKLHLPNYIDTVIINLPISLDAIKELIRVFSHQMGKNVIICTSEITMQRLKLITPGMTYINKKYFKEKSNKALMEADYPLMSFVDVDESDILRFSKILTIKQRTAICLDSGRTPILASSDLLTMIPADIAIDEAIIRAKFIVNNFTDTKKIIDQVQTLIY